MRRIGRWRHRAEPPAVGRRPARRMVGHASCPESYSDQRAVPVRPGRESPGIHVRERRVRAGHVDSVARGGAGRRPAGAAAMAAPGQRAGALPDGDDHRRRRQGPGDDPAGLLPAGRQLVRCLCLDVHDRGNSGRRRPHPLPRRDYEGYLSYAAWAPRARHGPGVRRGGGGQSRARLDGPRARHGVDHVGARADRADEARHRRLPRRRQRAAADLGHGLRRNHGDMGPAAGQRPGPALSRGDLRQRRPRRDGGPAGAAQHRRHGEPDQRADHRARPRPAGRPWLVDGHHDRPGPRGAAPGPGEPPGPMPPATRATGRRYARPSRRSTP